MIVVDVGSATAFEFDCGESLSPWRLLWRRIMPFVKRLDVPSIGAILMRTTEVSSPQRANEVMRKADLWLRRPIDVIGVLDFA